MVLVRSRARSTMKTGSENSFCPHKYFTEHLVCVFRKLPRKNNLDHKFSRLSIRWLNSTTGIQPATFQSQHKRDLGLTTKSRTVSKETEAGGACCRRERKHSGGGADQRGLGEHGLKTEKDQQQSVLAPTELRNLFRNQRTEELKREKETVPA
jgi:hypothetical protein